MIAAAPAAAQSDTWAYLAVFVLMALTFIGVPAVGAAVVGWGAVLASQGKLNIVAVLIVAALGAEAGGLIGYSIGATWGRRLVDIRGPWRRQRENAVTRAEDLYAKWGRLAIFLTPTMVSGILRMKFSRFVVWNFIVGSVYVLAVGPTAYGAGKIVAQEEDGSSLAALLAGVAVAAGCAVLAARYYRRRRAARLLTAASAGEADAGADSR
jgi:membrane-associated protein